MVNLFESQVLGSPVHHRRASRKGFPQKGWVFLDPIDNMITRRCLGRVSGVAVVVRSRQEMPNSSQRTISLQVSSHEFRLDLSSALPATVTIHLSVALYFVLNKVLVYVLALTRRRTNKEDDSKILQDRTKLRDVYSLRLLISKSSECLRGERERVIQWMQFVMRDRYCDLNRGW